MMANLRTFFIVVTLLVSLPGDSEPSDQYSASESESKSGRRVDFIYDGQTLRLLTQKSYADRQLTSTIPAGYEATFVYDEFFIGIDQYFIGSLLESGHSKQKFRSGIFKTLGSAIVLVIDAPGGFSIVHAGKRYIFLYSAYAIEDSPIWSRIYLVQNSHNGNIEFKLLEQLDGLAVMDAVSAGENLVISGFCDGAEFGIKLTLEKGYIKEKVNLAEVGAIINEVTCLDS